MRERLEQGVIAISRQGVFALDEARNLLPVVRKITQEYSQDFDRLISRLEAIASDQLELITQLEAQINELIQTWHSKVRKLGGVPKGLWLVDFDSGDGYFCWKYPEPELIYWHSYTEGFTKRIRIENKELGSLQASFGESSLPSAEFSE